MLSCWKSGRAPPAGSPGKILVCPLGWTTLIKARLKRDVAVPLRKERKDSAFWKFLQKVELLSSVLSFGEISSVFVFMV